MFHYFCRMASTPCIVLGLMSGTSLDGLDIAAVAFQEEDSWELLAFRSYPYSEHWQHTLRESRNLSGLALTHLDIAFARLQAEYIRTFLEDTGIRPQAIASHGHTVFHQPDQGITLQIGDGETLYAHTGIPVITHFRIQDIQKGGQGAPLVPAGELALFPEYAAFVNLGGFANIHVKSRYACDTGPCNMLLNYLIAPLGLPFDADGELAASGKIIPEFFDRLNAIPYFHQAPPKSLGAEWFAQEVEPIVKEFENLPIPDLLHTSCHHIAWQIISLLPEQPGAVMVTGGGVHHLFLLKELIRQAPWLRFDVPDAPMADAKEAVIFAWLGYRRLRGLPNTLPELTGASEAVSGGSLHGPFLAAEKKFHV